MINSEKRPDVAIQPESTINKVEIPMDEVKFEYKRRASYVSTYPISRGWSTHSRRFSNMFAARKTVAQGMMDIALITANANQLRYLLDYARESNTFYTILILIVISLVLQIIVGVLLIFKGRYDFLGEKPARARSLKSYVTFGVFLITIINIFISALHGSTPTSTTKKI